MEKKRVIRAEKMEGFIAKMYDKNAAPFIFVPQHCTNVFEHVSTPLVNPGRPQICTAITPARESDFTLTLLPGYQPS